MCCLASFKHVPVGIKRATDPFCFSFVFQQEIPSKWKLKGISFIFKWSKQTEKIKILRTGLENADFQLEAQVNTKKINCRADFSFKTPKQIKSNVMHCIVVCVLSSGTGSAT